MGAPLAFGVVGAFLVGAAEDAIRHGDALDLMLVQAVQHLIQHARVVPDIHLWIVPFDQKVSTAPAIDRL
ncbi:MAG: hypothetical protein ACO1SX_14925 [Actinomycetota bacterium]